MLDDFAGRDAVERLLKRLGKIAVEIELDEGNSIPQPKVFRHVVRRLHGVARILQAQRQRTGTRRHVEDGCADPHVALQHFRCVFVQPGFAWISRRL